MGDLSYSTGNVNGRVDTGSKTSLLNGQVTTFSHVVTPTGVQNLNTYQGFEAGAGVDGPTCPSSDKYGQIAA
ncbi:MAG: hypothetical protein M3O03_00905 [Pseudomonadota bacterium]|nr:hypothetical protein [Pseudomonadota bacterium]